MVGAPRLGQGWATEAWQLPTACPDALPSPSQLIPLQAPLKTMLQIGVMPMLNERMWRGVQIPLPEGINFVREVVTNHAVSGGVDGGRWSLPAPDSPPT